MSPLKQNTKVNTLTLTKEVAKCFIIGSVNSSDFFLDTDEIKSLPLTTKWEDIAVEIGLFKSKSDAKRNNFSGDIPEGWNEGTAKGGKLFVFIHKQSLTNPESV
jgi:hypothetical protein